MTISLYDATVPSFLQQLRALDGLLCKAEAWCAETGTDEADIQSARIAPDMLPFSWQVRWGPAHSIKAIEAIRAGTYSPDFDEPPATFAEQRESLAQAIAALEALDRTEVDGLVGKEVVFTIPGRDVNLPFTAENFLFSFTLPNFYFHIATAYDLLRSKGVAIGKMDFLGEMRLKGMA